MAKQGLQYKIATSRITLPVTFVLTLLVGGTMGWLIPDSGTDDPYIFRQLIRLWIPNEWSARLLTLLFHCIVGYLLIEVNNAFAIIRMRTSLQTSLYGWLLLGSPFLLSPGTAPLVSCCFILSLYHLFKGYQQFEPVSNIFQSWLYFGVSTLLFPTIFWLMPFMLLGAYQFKELTWRTLFAGLVGLCVPYWFLGCFAFFFDRMDLLQTIFTELTTFHPICLFLPPVQVLGSATLFFLLWISSSIHYIVTSYEDKIRTRSYMLFLIILGFALFVLGCLQPQHALMLLSLLLPLIALLGTHFFALSYGKLTNLFFLLSLALLVALLYYNLWMLSYNS